MIIRTITLIISLLFAISTHSQTILPDTLHNDIEFCETDSLHNIVEQLSGDSLQSNNETFYHNIWNSTQIRYPLTTLPPKDVMVTVRLTEPYDHPYVQPVIGKVISKYGHRGRRMHTGTDIKLNAGDTVRSAFDGKVRLAKRFSGYGNLVLVRHSNGLETIYAHLQSIHVNVNDTIKAGDFIGLGGRTGRATCDHLHFETRLFGEPFDSNKYIDFERYALRSNHIYYKNKQFEIDPQNFNKKEPIETKMIIAANESLPAIGAKVSTNTKPSKHVIRKGDSLSAIARKYNTSVKNLCAVNNITAQKTLKVGTVLRLN